MKPYLYLAFVLSLVSANQTEISEHYYFGNQKEPVEFINGKAKTQTISGQKEFEIKDSSHIYCKAFINSEFYCRGVYKMSTDTVKEVIQVAYKYFKGEFKDSVVLKYIFKKHGNWVWDIWGEKINGYYHYGKQKMPSDKIVYLSDLKQTFMLKNFETKFTTWQGDCHLVSNHDCDTLLFWRISDYNNWENGQYVSAVTQYTETHRAINTKTGAMFDSTFHFSSFKPTGTWRKCQNGQIAEVKY
ncbi:MAG: hypothetical protein ACPGLV_07595 [Bacteroidia bacterium]